MNETLASATRMDAVQTPIVPIIGALHPADAGHDLARPGRRALRTAARSGSRPRVPRSRGPKPTNTRTAPDCRRCSIASRGSWRPRTASTSRAARIMVTAGANMAFMHAVLATTSPGDEVILPDPVLFQSRDGHRDGGVPRRPRPDRRSLSAVDSTRSRARSRSRTRAIVTISPNNPSGAVLRGGGAARSQRAVPRSRAVPHLRRDLRVLHLRRRTPRLARLVRGC